MEWLSLLIVVGALAFLMVMAYKGHSVILFAPIAAMGAVLLTDPALVAPMFSGLFMDKVATFLKLYFPVFLLGALHGPRRPGGRKGYGVLAFLGAATGIGIAGRHVWVQLYPPLMPSCGPGWDYMIETNTWLGVVQKVLTAKGDCSTIDWSFLGLTMPMWSLVWFVLLAVWALWIGFRARRTSTFR